MREARRRWAAAAAMVCAFSPTAARALVGDTDAAFGLDGSLTTFVIATQNYDAPLVFGPDSNRADGRTDLLLRLIAAGAPAPELRYEVHGVQSVTHESFAGSSSGTSVLGAGRLPDHYQAMDARWRAVSEGDVEAWLRLDRFNLAARLPHLDLTVGRQAVAFGKTYFWNPLDVFEPFGAVQLDREYKAGVDALRADIPFGDFSGANLVGAVGDMQDEGRWRRAALLGRLYATRWGWDWSLQLGKVLGGYHVGVAAAGELGPVELRAEGAYFEPLQGDALPRHASAVLGAGHTFAGRLGVQVEHLVNGAAPAQLARGFALVAAGRLLQASHHMTGVSLQWDAAPLVDLSLAALMEWDHAAVLIQPGFVYSAADEVDVIAGAMLISGERPSSAAPAALELNSELGTYPNLYYVELKVYF